MSKPRENVISESSAGLKVPANTMTRRGLVQAGAAGVAGIAATTALSASPVRQALAQGSGWQGEIVMFAQAYTPNSKLPDAVQLKAFQEVADEYQKTHPGVTI